MLETKVKALETELGVARTETVEEVFRMVRNTELYVQV